MTETGVFAKDRSSLLACADALADAHRWADAARFAERAVPADDPDHAMRVELVWWLLRAGRPRDAAARLATLPDGAHPELVALRFAAAGLSDPDKAPAMLRGLLTEVTGAGRDRATPNVLWLVMLLALGARDRRTALQAAEQHAALIRPLDPKVGALLAAHRALEDDLADAVHCAEHALAGRLGEETAALDEIARDTAARGDGVLALRLLAEGFLRTGRDAYAELLLPRLPARIRWRNRIVGLSVSALVFGVGLAASGLPGVLPAALALLLGGAVTATWAAFASTPGLNRPRTNRLCAAYAQYHARHGYVDALPAVFGAAAVGCTVPVLAGREVGALGWPVLAAALACGLLAALGAIGVVRICRRRALARAARVNQPVAADACRCWEADVLLGERWQNYVGTHLDCAADRGPVDSEWRRCPETGRTWLHLPPAAITLAVRIPTPY